MDYSLLIGIHNLDQASREEVGMNTLKPGRDNPLICSFLPFLHECSLPVGLLMVPPLVLVHRRPLEEACPITTIATIKS